MQPSVSELAKTDEVSEASTPWTDVRSRIGAGIFFALIVRFCLDLYWVLYLPAQIWDWEAGQNIGVGVLAASAEDPSLLLTLRHKAFCGGCSIWSALSWGQESWLYTKLISVLWVQVIGCLGVVLLLKHSYKTALIWSWMYACVPALIREVQLVGWANHAESMLFLFLSLSFLFLPFRSPHKN